MYKIKVVLFLHHSLDFLFQAKPLPLLLNVQLQLLNQAKRLVGGTTHQRLLQCLLPLLLHLLIESYPEDVYLAQLFLTQPSLKLLLRLFWHFQVNPFEIVAVDMPNSTD